MAFFTRPELDNRQFKQVSGSTLTLSGTTEIVSGGTFILHGREIIATGGTYNQVLGVDIDGKIRLIDQTGSGGTGVYMLDSPASLSSPVGGISNGYVLAGKPLDVILRDMLVVYQAPAFTSFSSSQTTPVEVGTVLSGSRTFTWATSNSGNVLANSIVIRDVSSGTTLATGLANDGSELVTINNRELATNGSTQVWRAEGTNTQSGTFISSNYTVTARYLRFYGPASTTPTTSAAVRALPLNAYQTADINTFILNTGNVLTKFVVALPPGRVITSVIDLDALNANITANYVLVSSSTPVLDNGGSGPTIWNYNIYEMNVGTPYSSNHKHQITTA